MVYFEIYALESLVEFVFRRYQFSSCVTEIDLTSTFSICLRRILLATSAYGCFSSGSFSTPVENVQQSFVILSLPLCTPPLNTLRSRRCSPPCSIVRQFSLREFTVDFVAFFYLRLVSSFFLQCSLFFYSGLGQLPFLRPPLE